MEAKYHLIPETGEVKACRATKKACPIGGDHYATPGEARDAFELQNDAWEALASFEKFDPDCCCEESDVYDGYAECPVHPAADSTKIQLKP